MKCSRSSCAPLRARVASLGPWQQRTLSSSSPLQRSFTALFLTCGRSYRQRLIWKRTKGIQASCTTNFIGCSVPCWSVAWLFQRNCLGTVGFFVIVIMVIYIALSVASYLEGALQCQLSLQMLAFFYSSPFCFLCSQSFLLSWLEFLKLIGNYLRIGRRNLVIKFMLSIVWIWCFGACLKFVTGSAACSDIIAVS